MAISIAKKTKIIAEWKTGRYSMSALAKKHRIARSTMSIVVKGIPQETAELVDKLIKVEFEKSNKNHADQKAVDNEVKRALKRIELSTTIMDIGLQATAKNIVEVNKAVQGSKVSANDRSTHQRTIKMGVETVRAVLAPLEQKQQVTDYDITPEEISVAIADGLPD